MRLVLALLLPITGILSLLAQDQKELPYELHFVSTDQDDFDRSYTKSYLAINDKFSSPEHTFLIQRALGGKAGESFFIYAKDVKTGKQVATGSFDPGWDKDTYYDHMAYINGRLYMLYEKVKEKTGEIQVFAQAINSSSLKLDGAPQLISTVTFDPRSLTWPGRLNAMLVTSGNGEYTAFYFDGIRTKEDEQLILVSMLDKNLAPLWTQGYRLQIDAEKLSTKSVKVGNNGTAYALVYGRIKKKDAPALGGFQLLALGSEGMQLEAIKLPMNMGAMNADLALHADGSPVVAGFYMVSEGPFEQTTGYYVSAFNKELTMPVEAEARAFDRTLEDRIENARLLPRTDGGMFLTGEGYLNKGSNVIQDHLFAASINAAHAEVWRSLIPRAYRAKWVYGADNSYSMLFRDGLVMLAPDNEENIANYRRHAELETVRGAPETELAFVFDASGEYAVQRYGPRDTYTFQYPINPGDAEMGLSTYSMAGSTSQGKRKFGRVYFLPRD